MRDAVRQHQYPLDMVLEMDGRVRAELGLPVELHAYIEAFPQLRSDPAAFDAAVDAALRANRVKNEPLTETAERLAKDAPDLHGLIMRTALISEALETGRPTSLEGLPGGHGSKKPGDRIGSLLVDGEPRYELGRELGSGARGRVFEAQDWKLAAKSDAPIVAIKLLGPWTDERHRALLEREGTNARRVESKHVARVLDLDETAEGEPFLVLERISGTPLCSFENSVDWRQIAIMMRDIAMGAQAIHDAGLVHRDLKPSNILVTEREGERSRATIVDFSSAFAESADDDWLHSHAGALGVAAPELTGGARPSPKSDVFAIAALGVWMAGGDAVLASKSSLIEQIPQSFPKPLRGVLANALAPDPKNRTDSAAVLAEQLRDVLQQRVPTGVRVGAPRRVVYAARRRPVAALAAIAGVIGCIAFASWFHASRVSRAIESAIERFAAESGGIAATRVNSTLDAATLRDWLMTEVLMGDLEPHLQPLVGPYVADSAVERTALMRSYLDGLVENGRSSTLEANLLRLSLVLRWCNERASTPDAAAEAVEALRYLEASAGPSDPLTEKARLLHAVAQSKAWILTDPNERDSGAIGHSFETLSRFAAASLGAPDSPPSPTMLRDPVNSLVLRALFRVSRSDRLNETAMYEWAEEAVSAETAR